MPPKRNTSKKVKTTSDAEVETESPKRKGGNKSGGGGKRYDVMQKSATGAPTTVGTFQSNDAAQREVERLVAHSNNSLKLHDFEIVPSK